MRPLLPLLILASSISAQERPNILFLFSDDHAIDAISAYGGPLKELAPTPNIDRIASEGSLFTRSYCCNSICGPSRAAILTGKHSHVNGFLDNNNARFDSRQTTFPKLLQSAGYQTSLIGKWHLVSRPTGFDHWEILPGQGNYYNPDFLTPSGKKREQGYVTDIITDKAIRWLEKDRDPTKPFVLMCQHKAPHRNWAPAPRHLTLFKDVTFPEPATLFDTYDNRSRTVAEQKMSIARDFSWAHDMKFHGKNLFPGKFTNMGNGEYQRMTPPEKQAWDGAYEPENQAFIEKMKAGAFDDKAVTRWKYQRYMKDYLRCVRAVDENVGRMLDYLEKSGLAKNTLVIYSADQGFYLGEHGWYDKRWMFEESLSMPFIARWPGVVPPGTRNQTLIQNIDYAPTFLEAAGVPVPPSIQGKSLLPVLMGGTPDDWRTAIYYFYSGENTHQVAAHDGVRSDRYKLMYFPDTREWNLFDLEQDPDELRSVHEDIGYATVLDEMKETYRELRAEYRMSPASLPTHRLSKKWWKARHEEKCRQAKTSDHDVIFIGDSITQNWESAGASVWENYYGPETPRSTLNLGFSGDRTEHVLWRLMNGELENVNPKLFVLMIGTNNTGQRQDPPAQTADGIKLIVDLLRDRCPDSNILLLSIFPRDELPTGDFRQVNRAINQQIQSYATDDRVYFRDLGAAFLSEDGTLPKETMPDFLHLQQEAYEKWADAIESQVAELTGTPEVK